jgi:hypothetical protein
VSLDVHLYDGAPCDKCGRSGPEVYWANITHNLGGMATAAGIYEALWRPEEVGITTASQLLTPLATGLAWLKLHEAEARKHDAPNGWGLYEHFVPFVEKYLDACNKNPLATIRVSR